MIRVARDGVMMNWMGTRSSGVPAREIERKELSDQAKRARPLGARRGHQLECLIWQRGCGR